MREAARPFKREAHIHRYARGHVRGMENYMKIQRLLGFGTAPAISYVSDSHTSYNRRKPSSRMMRNTAICPADLSASQTMRGTLRGSPDGLRIYSLYSDINMPLFILKDLLNFLLTTTSTHPTLQPEQQSQQPDNHIDSFTISKATAIMKFTPAVIIALAAVAAAAPDDARPPTASPTASPTPSPAACTPGTYACTADARGWQVCDVSGQFVVSSFMS